MAKARNKSDFINFTIFHNEFIETDILNGNEKLVFMAIKRHMNSERKISFPSISKISKYSRLCKSTVQKTLKTLEDKGIIEIEHRKLENNGNTSNIYTVHDYKSMWTVKNNKDIRNVIKLEQEQEAIKLLESIGYIITKEKGLTSAPTKVTDIRPPQKYDIYNKQHNTSKIESQDIERYTLNQIHQLFEYDIMVLDYPLQQNDIDSVMSILYTAMNTTKSTIRIAGEDKPTMVVIGKLMKLHKESIMYAIKQFSEQTERIKNPTAYMLTILYNAPEQFNLDIQNRVSHDMANWNRAEE